VLEIKNLRKRFGGLKAVWDCSLTVGKGSITGLIGPNGAGKTTLFHLITGFYKPDQGEIIFKGEPVHGLQPHQIFKKGIFRTFQITREFNKMTVLENLMIVRHPQTGENIWNTWFLFDKVRKEELAIKEKALEILEFVELIDHRKEYAGSLSGGQKKLLELAKCMMAEPELVLLDEPGAGVNPTLMKKLIEKIKTLSIENNMTFFLIEHDMDLVMNLCNPVIVMSEGRKLTEGDPDYIRSHEGVLEAYLGGQYGVDAP
jgi:branched-chain amino acid transport system ATP-binding protein